VEAFLAGGWAQRNTRTPRVLEAQHAGFLLEEDVYSREEIAQDPIIQDFLRPRGLGWATATAFPMPTGDTLVFSIERRHADGPVPREAVAVLDGLRPHLGRAALLSARLQLERARAAVEALALLGLPAGIVTHNAKLQSANDLLQALMPRIVRDGRSRVAFSDPRADALLARALAGGAGRSARSIPIPASGEDPATVAHLVPVRGAARDIFAGSAALLALTPVVPGQVPGAELLQGLFDLTAAEARVARGIAEGATIAGLARGQGVLEATVRSQVKAAFAKTGVSRQVDLARLLSGLVVTR
ncbi:helix-turn-helix transcriptional regulator, partial [Methylobacterium soli]